MITIIKAIKSCEACPAQWNLWDDNDNYYYVRYRHGIFTIDQARTEKDWWDRNRNTILSKQIGSTFDGDMKFSELIDHTKDLFIFNCEEIPYEFGEI